MQCTFLHILNFPTYIFILCVASCILYFPACVVRCFMYFVFSCLRCALLHVFCIFLPALRTVSCIMSCFTHAKSHFGHIPDFLEFYIQNFFVFMTDKWCFPLFLDIKSLTFLIYVQFSSNSIPFSPTLSLILDISCHFLFFISNFCPAKFFFHLHRPWLWIFPAIFS